MCSIVVLVILIVVSDGGLFKGVLLVVNMGFGDLGMWIDGFFYCWYFW